MIDSTAGGEQQHMQKDVVLWEGAGAQVVGSRCRG
jgi:hypothetical protein